MPKEDVVLHRPQPADLQGLIDEFRKAERPSPSIPGEQYGRMFREWVQQFIGVDPYLEACGTMMRDLFQGDDAAGSRMWRSST